MRLIHLSLIATGAGLVLIGLSVVWPHAVESSVWSGEQAHERAEAFARLHQLSHQHRHDHAPGETHANHQPPDPDEMQAARKRYEAIDAELRSAKTLHTGIAAVLKWAGVLSMTVGVAGYFVSRAVQQT